MIPFVLIIAAFVLVVVTGFAFPATPFNGLSVLAMVFAWIAVVYLIRKGTDV